MLHLHITTTPYKKIVFKTLGLVLILGALVIAGVKFSNSVNALPTVINVTTTTDEDSAPAAGTGCSLYEASVAANTAAAYGGCTAGTVGNNVIAIPAGTYLVATHTTIILNNTSILGASRTSTILQGYILQLTGDDAASVKDVAITNDPGTTDSPALLGFNIYGSHKTLDTIDISMSVVGYITIDIANNAQTITDTKFINSNLGSADTTAILIGCNNVFGLFGGTGGVCSSTHFTNDTIASSTLAYAYLAEGGGSSLTDTTILGGLTITFGDATTIADSTCAGSCGFVGGANSSVTNVTMSDGSSDVALGDNSTVDGLYQNLNITGGISLTTGAGSTINDVTQDATGSDGGIGITGFADSVTNIEQSSLGASITFNIETPVVNHYSSNGTTNVTFSDPYVGSTISDVTISGGNGSTNFNNQAVSLTDVHITTPYDASNTFTNNMDNAVISRVSMADSSTSSNRLNATIQGNNVTVNDLRLNSAAGSLNFNVDGTGDTFTNLSLTNMMMNVQDPNDLSITNFTIAGSPSSGIDIEGDISDISLKNGYIANTKQGIIVNAGSLVTGSKVLISNVQIDETPSDRSYSAIQTNNIDQTTIEDTTVYRATQSSGATIEILHGSHHIIRNTTVVNANGGIEVDAYDMDATPMTLDVNNVTILNNVDTTGYDANTDQTALVIGASTDSPITANVTNSVIAGTSPYDKCAIFSPSFTTLNIVHSYASDASCAGFTSIADVAGAFASALAQNPSQNLGLGYKNLSGKLQTVALSTNSELIGAGDTTTCQAKDARGQERDLAQGCDVGAYQAKIVVVPPTPDPDPTPTPSGGSGGSFTTTTTSQAVTTVTDHDIAVVDEPVKDTTPTTDSNTPTDTHNDDSQTTGQSAPNLTIWFIIGGAILVVIIVVLIRRRRQDT